MELVVATACPTLATGGSSEDDDLSECHFPVLPMAHGGDRGEDGATVPTVGMCPCCAQDAATGAALMGESYEHQRVPRPSPCPCASLPVSPPVPPCRLVAPRSVTRRDALHTPKMAARWRRCSGRGAGPDAGGDAGEGRERAGREMGGENERGGRESGERKERGEGKGRGKRERREREGRGKGEGRERVEKEGRREREEKEKEGTGKRERKERKGRGKKTVTHYTAAQPAVGLVSAFPGQRRPGHCRRA